MALGLLPQPVFQIHRDWVYSSFHNWNQTQQGNTLLPKENLHMKTTTKASELILSFKIQQKVSFLLMQVESHGLGSSAQ